MALVGAGARVAWVVPTYRNARPLWRFCQQWVTHTREPYKVNLAEMTVEAGRGWLGIYSADNDTALRGEAFHLVVIDEAPQIKGETYTDVIMPTLADYNGHCVLIGTPKGMNWFYTEFQRGLMDGQIQASFHAPSNANPLPSVQRAFELAKQRVSERTFRQEWLAEFVEDGGMVLRNVDELCTLDPQPGPIAGHTYIGGVDWGRFNDATVFVILDATAKQMAYIDRMLETDFRLQLTRLKALHQRFGVTNWIAEYNSLGGPQVEALQNAGLPVQAFTTTSASKAALVDRLALATERGDWRFVRDAVLISEMKSYTSERLPSGVVRYGAPEGMHDDTVMALALALSGAALEGLLVV